jgi:uncharacterized cupredoxin-like copper-binding protein
MKRAFFILTLFVVSALLALTVYSSQDAANTIQIKVGDFYFKPETVQLKAGLEVKIELANEGKLEHEFMVGRGVKMEKGEAHGEMEMPGGGEQETPELECEPHDGMHEARVEISRGFEKDFFEGIEVVVHTENGAEFMRVPGHGTMVTLKPQGKAMLTFKVPTDRKGEWIVACFMPGHYERKMKGTVIVK